MATNTETQAVENKKTGFFSYWCDYYELCKPRVVMLLVFTAVIGMRRKSERAHGRVAAVGPARDADLRGFETELLFQETRRVEQVDDLVTTQVPVIQRHEVLAEARAAAHRRRRGQLQPRVPGFRSAGVSHWTHRPGHRRPAGCRHVLHRFRP